LMAAFKTNIFYLFFLIFANSYIYLSLISLCLIYSISSRFPAALLVL
jgi:hypothetical protein